MPELPEIYHLSLQLQERLVGHQIKDVVFHQEKCSNVSIDESKRLVLHRKVTSVTSKGKWLFIRLDNDVDIRINLGMGGDLLLQEELPKQKYQAHITLENDVYLSFRFWWFGHVHFIEPNNPHPMTDKLGKDYLRESSKEEFIALIQSKKGSLKTVLLNQSYFAGMGNYYIHDVLFKSKIHPQKKCPDVSKKKLGILYDTIIEEFTSSIAQRGAHYEVDTYNKKGEFSADLVAYKENHQCPVCETTIKKIKTGSTTSYYCQSCQK